MRIAAIDSCRGVMLFLMTITHLFNLSFLTINFLTPYGKFGFFTDAEGFIFLAGLVAGLVYGRMFLDGREPLVASRMFQRIKQMYIWQTVLYLGVTLCMLGFTTYAQNWENFHEVIPTWVGKEGIHFFIDHPVKAFGLGCCFLYLPPFLDLLPMYMIFLCATPLLLRRIHQGKILGIVLLSATLWVSAQIIPSRLLETTLKGYLPACKLGWFDPFAWQLLFIAGLIIGYLKAADRLPKPPRPLIACSVIAVLAFFSLRHFGPPFPIAANLYELGIIRILSFGAIACTIWGFHQHFTFRPFAYIGKYPLPVFLYHSALTYFLIFFKDQIDSLPLISKLVLLALVVSTIWIPAYFCERRKQARFPAPAKA